MDAMHRLGQIWGVQVSRDRNGVSDAVLYQASGEFVWKVAYANFMFRVMHRRNQYPDLPIAAAKLVRGIDAAGRVGHLLFLVVEWRGGLFYWQHSKASEIRLEYEPLLARNANGPGEETVVLVPTRYFKRVTASRNPFLGAGADRNRDKVLA